MNDFDFDVKEKKRIATGARARKCGSKSKRCTLPSDYLTAKQRKGLNGKMKTYNLSAPMTYSAFRGMPKDLQKEYLTKLYLDWCISTTEIGKMFKCSPETVRKTCNELGIDTSNRGHRANDAQMQHWHTWLNENRAASGEAEQKKAEEKNYISEESVNKTEGKPEAVIGAIIQSASFTVAGCPEGILEQVGTLLKLLDPDIQYQATVKWVKAEEVCGRYGQV